MCGAGVDTVEPELGAAEHRERAVVIHLAPRQVDEAPTRPALDVRSPGIEGSIDNARGRAVQVPGHRRGIARLQVQPLGRLVTTLHADVDVAVSGKIAAATAVASGKIMALDADSHRFTVSGPCSEGRLSGADRRADRGRGARVSPCDVVSVDHLFRCHTASHSSTLAESLPRIPVSHHPVRVTRLRSRSRSNDTGRNQMAGGGIRAARNHSAASLDRGEHRCDAPERRRSHRRRLAGTGSRTRRNACPPTGR